MADSTYPGVSTDPNAVVATCLAFRLNDTDPF